MVVYEVFSVLNFKVKKYERNPLSAGVRPKCGAVTCEYGEGKSNSDCVYSLNISNKSLQKIPNKEGRMPVHMVLLYFISEVGKYERNRFSSGGSAKT